MARWGGPMTQGGLRLVPVDSDPFVKITDQPGLAPGWIADPQKALRPATVEEQMAGPQRNKLLDLVPRDLAPRLSYQQLLDERQAQREGGVHPGRMEPYPRTMGDNVALAAMSLPLGALSVIGGGIKGGVNLLRNLATLPQRMTAAERTGGTEAALDLAVGPATETALTLMTGGAGRALTAGRTRAELGIFGGPGARTADHGALARAQERLAAGESRDRVWKETGWGKDQYGHWFFEIPDDKIRIRMEPGDTAVRGRADEFVDHPEMFDAYPILRDANVTIRIDPSLKHSRDGSAQYTLVNIVDDQGDFVRADPPIMSIVVTAKNEQAARETLVHEFEHLVQGLEGRERGGSMQDQPVLDMARAEVRIDRDRALPRYREVLSEKQAFTQDWIARNRDNFPDPVMAEFAAERAFGRERGELASEFYSLREKLYGEGARLSMRDAVFNAYRRLRGETQALNAEKRTDWDAESRASVGPWRTEKYSEDRQWTQGNRRDPITVRDPNAVRSVDQQATEAAMAASVGRQADVAQAAPDPREAGFNYSSGWPDSLPKPAIYDRAVALGEKLRADAQTASGRSWDLEMARQRGGQVDEPAFVSARAASTQASDDSWRLDMAIRDVRLASTPAERAASVAKLEQVYRELSGGAVKGAARRTNQPARRGALAGAPVDVRSPRDEARRRRAYLDFVMNGLEGRRWYEDSGGAIAFAAGDRREQTRRLAEAFAITSQRTNVSGNTGFAVQAANQAAVGMPIRTGAFPSKMSPRLEEALTGEGAASGRKVEPFAEQLMIGAGQGTGRAAGERAVHDMWDAQAWGYSPEAVKGGMGATQHRWMDRQVDRVVEYLNKNNVDGGGWTVGQVQAAAWTGVRKQRDSAVPGAYSFADALPRTYAQGSRETVPGDTTGHLVGLSDAPMEIRQAYDDEVANIIYDAKGRDRIAMGFGGLPGGSFRGPGIFEGGINPGRQSLLATSGAGGPGGSKALDAASTALLDATEATYGLLTAQKAAAYSRVFGAPRGVSNGAVIKLPGGPMSVEQATEIMRSGRYGGDVAIVPDREGVRLLYFGADKNAFQAAARAMADTLKGEKPRWGVVGGNLIENAWDKPEGRVGQQYMERIDRPELPRLGPSFDELAPPIAAKIRALDERWARRGFQVSPLIQELRAAISADGRAGVYKLAKKLGLGAAAITPFTQAGQAMGLLDEEGNPIEDRAPYRGRERREAYRTGASF